MSDTSIQTSDVKTLVKNNLRKYSMFLILAAIFIIFAILKEGYNLQPRNFYNIFNQNSFVLILAVGMVMVIIVQGIDLSVGSVCAFVGALSVMIYNTGIGMPMTLLLALLIGAAIGAFQGAWIAFAKLPAFIVTLAGMLLFRGLTYFVTKMVPQTPQGQTLADGTDVESKYSLLSSGTLDEVLNIPCLPIKLVYDKITYDEFDELVSIEENITQMFGTYPVDTDRVEFDMLSEWFYYPSAFVVAILILGAFFVAEHLGRRRKIANGFEVSSKPMFIAKLVIISVLTLALADRFAQYRGLPLVALVLGITIFIFHFIMNNTVLGRYIYAVGGNPKAAKLSGINSEMVTFIVFVFMGVLSGLAAVIFTGYMNTAHPSAGNLFELDAIAACYIGGVSAGGGIGSVVGVVVGGLVMGTINNGMDLMFLGQDWKFVVKASILLLAVFYDVYTRRKAGLG